eukprot:378153-Pelagomonas_calceolata.AAC.1
MSDSRKHTLLIPSDVQKNRTAQFEECWGNTVLVLENKKERSKKEKKGKVHASQVQLRALMKGFLTSKLAKVSPRRLTGLA